MKKKIIHLRNITFLIIALLVLNTLASVWFFRVDLTTEKRYTLSDNTKTLLNNLNENVYIHVYLNGDLNPGFEKLKNATKDLLKEMKIYDDNNIYFSFINPLKVKDGGKTIEMFRKMKMAPQQVFESKEDGRKTRTLIYPYAIIKYGDKRIPVNLLDNISGYSGAEKLNKSIESLEFKFTDALRKLTLKEKIKIAFLKGHNELDKLDVMDISNHLSAYYSVERITLNNNPNNLDKYKAVVIAKPQNEFTESDKFIIDQYIMQGGRVMWLVDAINITVDSLRSSQQTIGLVSDFNIEDQLFKYGVRINPVAVQDLQAAMIPVTVTNRVGSQNKIIPAPWLYSPLLLPRQDNAITKNINPVRGEFVSTIDTVNSKLNVKRTVLLTTSKFSKVTQAPLFVTLAFINERPDKRTFNKRFMPVAIMEEGIFNSVFTNRNIPNSINPKPANIIQKSSDTKMIIIADGDIIKNKVRFKNTTPQILPLGYDELGKKIFGNKDFILNSINYLCDDDGWMYLRNRNYKLRLLDKNKITNQAQFYKIINVFVPLLCLAILALIVAIYRKKKYK